MALGATGDTVLAERVGAATGAELAAMGVNVSYAPGLRPRHEPRQPAPRDPGVRRRPGDGGRVRGRDGPRAARRRGRGGGQALSGPRRGERGQPPRAAGDRRGPRAARRRGAGAVRARRSTAGAELVMSAHIALPAITGDPTLPATLSRDVMRDLRARRARASGASRSPTRSTWRRCPRGRRRASTSSRRSTPAWTCCCARRTRSRPSGSRPRSRTRRARRLFDPGELRASAARLAARAAAPRGGSRGRTSPSCARRRTWRSPARWPRRRSPSCATTTASCRSAWRPGRGSSRSCRRRATSRRRTPPRP